MTDLLTRLRLGRRDDARLQRWAAQHHDIGTVVEHLTAAWIVATGYAEHTGSDELLAEGIDPRIIREFADLASAIADVLSEAELLERSRAEYALRDRDDRLSAHGRELARECM